MIVPPPGGPQSRNAFSPRSNDADLVWTTGDAIEARIIFSEPVTVDTSQGTPTLGLVVEGRERTAEYSAGSGTDTLSFEYEVTKADGTVDEVSVTADSLALSGGTIRNDGGADAELSHPGASYGGMDELLFRQLARGRRRLDLLLDRVDLQRRVRDLHGDLQLDLADLGLSLLELQPRPFRRCC